MDLASHQGGCTPQRIFRVVVGVLLLSVVSAVFCLPDAGPDRVPPPPPPPPPVIIFSVLCFCCSDAPF